MVASLRTPEPYMQRAIDLYRPLITIPLQALAAGIAVWLGTLLFSLFGYELLIQGQIPLAVGVISVPGSILDVMVQRARRKKVLRNLQATIPEITTLWRNHESHPIRVGPLINDLQAWRSFADHDVSGEIDEAMDACKEIQAFSSYSLAGHLTPAPLERLGLRLEHR